MIKAQLVPYITRRGKKKYWYWRLCNTKKNKYLCILGRHPIDWIEAWIIAKKELNLTPKEHSNIIETLRINQHLSIELHQASKKKQEIFPHTAYRNQPQQYKFFLEAAA